MTRLSAFELAGFAAIVAGFVVVMALFDVEPQSWTSFTLLAVFFVLLYGYRYVLRRRRAHG
jgi:ribose/xylose/arabinose/galactoside ABC-type transport system permease subunit